MTTKMMSHTGFFRSGSEGGERSIGDILLTISYYKIMYDTIGGAKDSEQ